MAISVENRTKIANFHDVSCRDVVPVYLTSPLKGFTLEFCIGAGSEETRMVVLSDGQKSLKIGLVVLASMRYAYMCRAVETLQHTEMR